MLTEEDAGLDIAPLRQRREKLSDIVLQRLVDMLIASRLQPGDSLPSEGELVRTFGVSKPVVREAMHKLASMGIVEIRQGRPPAVKEMSFEPLELFFRFAMRASEDGLREAVELRRALETRIAALAAARIDDAGIAALRGHLRAMEKSLEDQEAWVAADLGFHMALATAAGNKLIVLAIEALRGTMEETIRVMNAQRPLRNPVATLERHAAIVGALAARDPDAALRAMDAHFDATEPVILAILAERRR